MAFDKYKQYVLLSSAALFSGLIVQISLPYVITASINAEAYSSWIFYFSYLAFLNLIDLGTIQWSQYNLLKLHVADKKKFMSAQNKSQIFLKSITYLFILITCIFAYVNQDFILGFLGLGILLNNITRYNIVVLRSMEKVEYYFSYIILLNILIIVFIFYLSNKIENLILISGAYFLAQFIIFSLSEIHKSHLLKNEFNDSYMNKKMSFTSLAPKGSIRFWKVHIMQIVNQNIIILSMGVIVAPIQLATIGAIRTMTNLGITFSEAVSKALLPRITYLDSNGESAIKINKFKNLYILINILIASLYTIFLYFLGNLLFDVWLNGKVQYDLNIMLLLIIRMVLMVLTNSLQNYKFATGETDMIYFMETFIIIFTLIGIAVSLSLSLDIYWLIFISFIIPHLSYFSYIYMFSKK